jgi:AhpD family alkylhydroperoxidase
MALDRKTLELIAIGASIGSECGDCLDKHLKTAREAGATPGELCNAIRMAEEVRQLHVRKNEKFLQKICDIVQQLGDMN